MTQRNESRHLDVDNSPRSVAFRKEREGQWAELEGIVDRALKNGLNTLNTHELHRLPILYRGTLASLSVARKTALDRMLIQYLEGLSGKAYLAIYGSRRATKGAVRNMVFRVFPRRVREFSGELLLSTLLVSLGVAIAIMLMKIEPGWYDAFVDPALAGGRDPNASTEMLRSALYSTGDELGDISDGLSLFASFLFVHNTRIGLLCFALGFAGGIPTAFLLFQNGLMLGAFIELYASRGLLFELGGWMLPHGIPEIGAIILCGAAGLHLGRCMLLPGRRTAREALAHAGRRASVIAAGAVVLFASAGLIEGIFRQVVINDTVRYSFAAFNALWFFGWLLFGGRGNGRNAPVSNDADEVKA